MLCGARTRAPSARARFSQPLCSGGGCRPLSPAAVRGAWEDLASLRISSGAPGRGRGALGSPSALLLGRLSPRRQRRRTKVSAGRPRDAARSAGLAPLGPAGCGAAGQGFPADARRHPPDSLERCGRAAGRAEGPCPLPVLSVRHADCRDGVSEELAGDSWVSGRCLLSVSDPEHQAHRSGREMTIVFRLPALGVISGFLKRGSSRTGAQPSTR